MSNKTEVLKSLLDTLDAKSIELKNLRNVLLAEEKADNAEDIEDINRDMDNLKCSIIRKFHEVVEGKRYSHSFLHDNVD